MIAELKVTEHYPIQGYKRFVFAYMSTNGLGHFLDTLRYDRAFLVRPMDLDHLIAVAKNPMDYFRPARLLLGKYSFGRADWTYERLMSWQSLDEIADPKLMYSKLAPFEASKLLSQQKFKFRTTCEFTGNLEYILRTMFVNRAFPGNEGDAHIMERALQNNDGEEITVSLCNFESTPEPSWRMPDPKVQNGG